MLVGAMLWGASGCVPPEARPPEPRPAVAATDAAQTPARLAVTVGTQATDGRIMRLRGTVRNQLDTTVEGLRLAMYVLSHAGTDAQVLERFQREMSVTLAPGESTALRWDVESLYFGSSGGFVVAAYPKRLGGSDVPFPSDWQH